MDLCLAGVKLQLQKQTQASCENDPTWSSLIDAPNQISHLTVERLVWDAQNNYLLHKAMIIFQWVDHEI